jgi:acetyl esterase/lipase
MSTLQYLQYALIRTLVNTSLYIRRSSYLSPATQPNFTKTYPCRPNLFPCRIFIPREHTGNLPLVIRAHGGGFVVNNPAADDPLARHLADTAQCVVVSIDYGKAPHNRFPTAFEDVIAQSLAVIEDEELPIDRERVVLCGNSAGGNLLLAAVQDARLRPKVVGIAAIYPLVDAVPDGDAKMATRPDPSIPDFIGGNTYAGILPLYLDPDAKPALTDTRLSPAYFESRDSLPPHVLMIGAEHDMFCHEGEQMAEKIAGDGARTKHGDGWRAPGVEWLKIYGQPHAFENFPVKDAEKEKARVEAVDKTYAAISSWLVQVFSKGQ